MGSLHGEMGKVIHSFSPQPIDVVIPCADKDKQTLEHCIRAIRKYGQNINRIIVVSKNRFSKEAEWFDENYYPFTKQDLALEMFHGDRESARSYLTHPKSRIGWIYQQLLKLYALFVIPNISPNLLVLDSDVIFLKNSAFMTEIGQPIFTAATEYHPPYFVHAKKLLPDLCRASGYSGIAHHILFQKPLLEDLFQLITSYHRIEPWKAVCRCIDPSEFSSLSEYEIYFNFVLLRTNQAVIQEKKWKNIRSLESLSKYQSKGYDFVACHEWLRAKK